MNQGYVKVIFRKKLVCQLLQQLEPGSRTYKLSILDNLHFLTSVWETMDSSITVNRQQQKVDFGSYIANDQNPQEDTDSSA
jgi:hypothetical protein